ncbi:disintegrin and metalloproteinase domain-containing protein 9 [Xenopus tropicalis]|uniref:Disintegrin and metalloproteinase domain-containing protein 9 n=1 Tax=Xenopus tropicalis TaxID=8364 RepID=A0A6I8PRY5_XENTR|nr:disintegrin and metalloproteinase domain-containing protein 9 [Xenopus tropicalis]
MHYCARFTRTDGMSLGKTQLVMAGIALLATGLIATEQDWYKQDWSSELQAYEIIDPLKIQSRGQTENEKVTFLIRTEEKPLLLRLKQKRESVLSNMKVFTYGKDNKLIADEPYMQDSCYYHGFVEGYPESSVSLSSCTGLRGFIQYENFSYRIEPLDPLRTSKHIMYRSENRVGNLACGLNFKTKTPSLQLSSPVSYRGGEPMYIEFAVVVSNNWYRQVQNISQIVSEITEMVNLMDDMFQSINIRIILIAIEVWTNENFSVASSSSGEHILTEFNKWKQREFVHRVFSDIEGFVIDRAPSAGMGYTGNACKKSFSHSFAVFKHFDVVERALIFAHNLGHSLGMEHDTDESCENCIMHCCAMYNLSFSEQSHSALIAEDIGGKLLCLKNEPSTESLFNSGNWMHGKYCDRGSEKPSYILLSLVFFLAFIQIVLFGGKTAMC